ncbi:MAG: cytochrome c biogenesis protein CcdA [Actinobacteria bacterium]|nr:cytochrome c biogenesis protein CcdA [Actinomycetota bacterium]
MGQVLFSTIILTAFIGGILALFAPCCISVMLPAYFASSFQRRSQILAMTIVFAAGVGTIILPIALGAGLVSRLLFSYHFWIFSTLGFAMVAVGIATLAGWKMMLPMPSKKGGSTGIKSVYGLGVFSGASSACCAPVLIGVGALSGAASSLPASFVVGIAYVFGMVAPLAVLALVWDRKNWSESRLLSKREVPLWPGSNVKLPVVTMISGGLVTIMGLLTILLAMRGPGMATTGWQIEVTAALGHVAVVIQNFLSFIPGWIFTVAIFGALTAIFWMAAHNRKFETQESGDAAEEACQSCATESKKTSVLGQGSFKTSPTGEQEDSQMKEPK